MTRLAQHSQSPSKTKSPQAARFDTQPSICGEAAIVALASRAQHLRPRLLSDDYDARILAHNHQVEPLSVHKLLTSMIAAGHVTPQTAARYADALRQAGRAGDYTADELQTGRLGRVGQP